jgi:formate dehydrogenase subunit delta
MDVGNLIRMANSIGHYFEALPDHAEALDGIANHIQKFWEPRMRRALLDFVAQHPDGAGGDSTLLPLVLEAVLHYRQRLTPAAPAPVN